MSEVCIETRHWCTEEPLKKRKRAGGPCHQPVFACLRDLPQGLGGITSVLHSITADIGSPFGQVASIPTWRNPRPLPSAVPCHLNLALLFSESRSRLLGCGPLLTRTDAVPVVVIAGPDAVTFVRGAPVPLKT